MTRFRLTTFLLLFSLLVVAQEDLLSKEEAITKALENNFGILVANNNLRIAENNKSLMNSGFLPSLTGNAGASYDKNNQEATFQDGNVRAIDGAETTRYNASLNLNYTLFDGLGRMYDFKRLKEEYNLSALETRETIETTMLQLFTVYFEVARLTENINVLEETFSNTKNRLQRAEYSFEFGRTNKLDVLNAEVDLVNDSINLMNERQTLRNTKRDLNLLLNRELLTTFEVDTVVSFTNSIRLEEFLGVGVENNVRILQMKQNIKINDYTLKSSKSVFLPTVGLTGSYGWNQGNFPATNFLASNVSTGVSAGLNLTWNLFNGGTSITQIKNARILLDNQEILEEQTIQEVKRDIENAKDDYQNRLDILALQEKNVITAQNNFDRSNEQYKLGQITSVELRQAQINLLNAQTNKNFAKYDAKLAELQLLQLTGQLLNVEI
ncbi:MULTISPECIES: TolC family protein [Maribacter]|uniref:TolC family protein n=1 Tax=Maribacter flavus TaxID=1658664 RepID=A0A5B2TZJ0_9FLAO|nr:MULTISPECIES: TolC family protein [Maribacter]KAA2219749.1 TolC family protein [Maribacter flavus]MDC6405336.1 TolC family protein [Maribacter sp. PR66]MEE1971855.1 TolC family protein [Maribacter flavus]